ncbi:MAG: hypothetical protein AB7F31_05390 [Parachlamydiales bacterium]
MCARWLPAVDALWTIGHNQGYYFWKANQELNLAEEFLKSATQLINEAKTLDQEGWVHLSEREEACELLQSHIREVKQLLEQTQALA